MKIERNRLCCGCLKIIKDDKDMEILYRFAYSGNLGEWVELPFHKSCLPESWGKSKEVWPFESGELWTFPPEPWPKEVT